MIAGQKIAYTTQGLDPLVNSVVGGALNQHQEAIRASFIQYKGGELASKPHNGIGLSTAQKLELIGINKAEFELINITIKELVKSYDNCGRSNSAMPNCTKFEDFIAKLPSDLKKLEHYKKIEKELKAFFHHTKKKVVNPEVASGQVYKARPLNGIWATAPYLHNGSVLSLMELLKPQKDRLAKFYVGNRELDVVNMGFVNQQTENSSLLDTSLLGNSNAGHSYGTELTEQQKIALVEYMKTL